ncbi:MAG: hypothetical protein WC121_09505 [Candidatus Kapaibacterium sp.]|jgi:hypothetical protein
MKNIITVLALLAFLSSCDAKKIDNDTPAVVDSTMGIIDNSKVGIVDENIDPKGSFEGRITFQLILQTTADKKKYQPLKDVFGDTLVCTYSKGRYAMQYTGGKVEYIKYLRDNAQYRKMKYLDTLYYQNAAIENSTIYSILDEKSDFQVLGRNLRMVSIVTDKFKKYYYYDPNMYMNPEYFKKHTYGYENKYYEKAKAPYLYAEIEYDDLKIILKPISIEEMEIDDIFFRMPNYVITNSPVTGE